MADVLFLKQDPLGLLSDHAGELPCFWSLLRLYQPKGVTSRTAHLKAARKCRLVGRKGQGEGVPQDTLPRTYFLQVALPPEVSSTSQSRATSWGLNL